MGLSRSAFVVVLVAAISSIALPTATVALAHGAPGDHERSAFVSVGSAPATSETEPSGAELSGAAPSATTPAAPPQGAPPDVASLPEARYDAVIPGLIAVASPRLPELSRVAYSLVADTPLSPEPGAAPIARLAATNFLGEPTVTVRVAVQGRWALVLTPARSALPSQNGGTAPAQTAGWVPAASLRHPVALPSSIVISLTARTLTIDTAGAASRTFPVGVGTASTPTPHGVTGYLQARYLDASQHQSRYPVQLSSLHSSAADEPFGGTDGGLIGVHYERTATGAVSHGCVRLSAEAVQAVDALAIGTPITITE